MVAEEMRRRTTAQWVEALGRADIPVQSMNSIDDIVADPHLAAIGYLGAVEHPTEGRIKSLAVPSEWSRSNRVPAPRAAAGGAHARGAARSGPARGEDRFDAAIRSGKRPPL